MLPKSDTNEDEIHLRDYTRVILRKKWIIMAITAILVTVVTIHSFKATPIYKTSVQILIDRENPNIVSFEEVMSLDSVDTMFYQTQLKILSSRSLARRVIKSLNLKDDPEFKSNEEKKGFSIKGVFHSLIGNIGPKKQHQRNDMLDEEPRLVDNYLSRLSIESIRNSRLVNIMFKGAGPDIITKIANQHAQEYIEKNLEMRFSASQDAVEWLQTQLFEKRQAVEKAEHALQLYKEEKQIVSLEDRQNIIVQKLEELNTTLTNARTSRIALETLYNQTRKFSNKPEMLESIPNVMKNPLIQELKREHINLETEITKLSDKYGKKHPSMIKLVSQAREQKKRTRVEIDKIIMSIETEYKVSLAKEESLSKALETQKEKALGLNRKAIAYGTLKRDAESESTMYGILLNRMKETNITGELKTSNIKIIDYAEMPRTPIKPRKKLNVLLALIVGLTLGLGTAFFLEYLDNTIKSCEDVEQYLGVPLLGILEKVKISKYKEGGLLHETIPDERLRNTFIESIRNIRTNIIFSSIDNPKRLMLVTSTSQGEGKSFVSSNLAVSFAQAGKKILLVDTDFRRPKLDKIFNVTMTPGLSNYLIGKTDLESIIKSTNIPHLSIVTCGVLPPDPAEMLGSHSMKAFCETVKDKFDTVIFDTPPAMTVTDAVVLSNIVDATIFVVKSGETVREVAKRAISQITNKSHDVIGAVINFVDISRGSYYYQYYGNYYKSEYSSNETAREKMETV